MMVIRPILPDDYEELFALAEKTGAGFTSLQPNEGQVRGKIYSSQEAFEKEVSTPGEETYLFVLEDTENGKIAGICGIEAAVGLSQPWYNYRVGTLVHSSRQLGVHNAVRTLTLSNDHTGYSEVCTLFLDPEYRHSKNGSLLSKTRFMFLAEFPKRFSTHIIAEMRGYSDENSHSPFWEGLGRHFFSMDFADAVYMAGLGDKTFIAELMPRHPIYTNMLPQSAQEVIGTVHDNTLPARMMLESEGFRNEGYVDIFDAGPTIETRVMDIRAVRESHYAKVNITTSPEGGEQYLMSNTSLKDFRCCLVELPGDHNVVDITQETADALKVAEGAAVRVVRLSSKVRK